MTETVFDPSKPHPDHKRELFCQELIAGADLYAAYVAADFKRPRGNAQRMAQEPEVAARLVYLHGRVEPIDIALLGYRRTEYRRALENVAKTDRLGLFEEFSRSYKVGKRRRTLRGIRLKKFAEITPEQRALIDGLEITDKGGLKVLMPKRLEARAMLAKLDGLDKAAKDPIADAVGDLANRLASALERANSVSNAG